MNKRNLIIIIGLLIFIIIVGGISYSYFIYNKDVGNVTLNTGDISINYSDVSGNMALSNVIPNSDNEGIISSNYIDFTVNATVDTERIYYELYLLPTNNNTLDTSYLKTYLTDQNDVSINGITFFDDLGDSYITNGKVIYKGIVEVNNNGTTKNENIDFRLRLWLDESYSEQTSKAFNFDIYVYAKNVDNDFKLPYGFNLVKQAIESKETCTPTWTDSDEVEYFSGDNTCVDMNYVWYSGKLWRITSIYPDGSMKLVTENGMTNILWGSTVEYNNSSIYQWLNEDFYDTLVNPNTFIKNASWNYSTDYSTPPVRPDTVGTQSVISGMVGLLGRYDYYNGYRNSSSSDNYLNIGYYWHTITPGNASRVGMINNEGDFIFGVPANSMLSVRPSIYLKSNVEFAGNGTKTSPYKVVGDRNTPQANSLLSRRSIGEYVNFNGNKYRIVEIKNGNTKLVMDGYLHVSNNVVSKSFASTNYFGKTDNIQSDNYLDYYLNNTWYNSLSNGYKNMLVNDTYYIAPIQGVNYKTTICSDNDLTGLTTKTCTKYLASDLDNTFTGKVGLLRLSEIFSAQPVEETPSALWLITRYDSNQNVRIIQSGGYIQQKVSTETAVVRPTITLNSSVRISSGTGYYNSPFEIK